MKLKNIFAAILLAFFAMSLTQCSRPVDEERVQLKALSEKAVAAGKEGNADAFLKATEEALKEANAQASAGSSASVEHLIPYLQDAVRQGKAGNLTAGVEAVEEALTYMEKKPAPKFGGGA